MSGPVEYYPPTTDESRLHALEYAVVDCETTGGSPARGHRVTEIAVVRVDRDGRVLDRVDTLVNPMRAIPRAITRITHIDDSMVSDAPLFAEIAPRVQQALAGAVFVAHNAPFDLRFVEWEMKRGDFAPPKGKVLCTARLARKLLPEMRSRSLDALIHRWAIPCDARHRALGDARATVDVLVRLLDMAAERGIGVWAELDRFLSTRKKRARRSALPRSMEYPEWA
ncbi:MAG: PolC-type DNA polymerase III [Gemmatimonadota bacterium]